jgi:hypothetical protein
MRAIGHRGRADLAFTRCMADNLRHRPGVRTGAQDVSYAPGAWLATARGRPACPRVATGHLVFIPCITDNRWPVRRPLSRSPQRVLSGRLPLQPHRTQRAIRPANICNCAVRLGWAAGFDTPGIRWDTVGGRLRPRGGGCDNNQDPGTRWAAGCERDRRCEPERTTGLPKSGRRGHAATARPPHHRRHTAAAIDTGPTSPYHGAARSSVSREPAPRPTGGGTREW